jgi:hypothetical protein
VQGAAEQRALSGRGRGAAAARAAAAAGRVAGPECGRRQNFPITTPRPARMKPTMEVALVMSSLA